MSLNVDSLESAHEFGIDREHRVIYFHHLGGDDSINWRTSSRFIKNLDVLEHDNNEAITIRLIASDGGDLADGLAIYSAIKNSPCHIHIIGYGYVCSAATIFMQAADYRSLMRESEFMVHHGSIWLDQTSLAARSTMRSNVRHNKMMLDIYAARCVNGEFFKARKYSVSRTRSYIDTKIKTESDWWLTSEDAVDMGFADEVI
jgi:ATP-dependent protease ClpP protease subunit